MWESSQSKFTNFSVIHVNWSRLEKIEMQGDNNDIILHVDRSLTDIWCLLVEITNKGQAWVNDNIVIRKPYMAIVMLGLQML